MQNSTNILISTLSLLCEDTIVVSKNFLSKNMENK